MARFKSSEESQHLTLFVGIQVEKADNNFLHCLLKQEHLL